MKLHVEQHQAAVSKGIDGAQGEGCHQGSKEGAPQGFQREVIAYLMESKEEKKIQEIILKTDNKKAHSFYLSCHTGRDEVSNI